MGNRRYRCPACQQKTGVDIVYGMPSEKLFKLAERQAVVLGGCCIDLDGPERACGHQWRILRKLKPID